MAGSNDSIYSGEEPVETLNYSGIAASNGSETARANHTTSGDDVIRGSNGANILNGAAGDDRLIGNAGNDTLYGGWGSDILNGGTGGDLLVGGSGDDFYRIDSNHDSAHEHAGGGRDTVDTTISYRLRNNFEVLRLRGSADINGTGNDQANALEGNSGHNRLAGQGGADDLFGHGGNDTISAGDGVDDLTGGYGRDVLIGGSGGDTFVFTTLADSGTSTATRDTIRDFIHTQDHIDLTAIEQHILGSNQHFSFIGTADFTKAGQVRVYQSGSDTIVELNAWGKSGADMSFRLEDVKATLLKSSDFQPTAFDVTVKPVKETTPVAGSWDTADDPAIWINKADPSKSVIIATNKDDNLGAINVYDLNGKLLSTYDQNDSYNNIDIRYGFKLGGKEVALVGATNRSDKTIDFFTMDATTHQLTKIGSIATGLGSVYGFTLAHTEAGKFYAFSTTMDGEVRQFELNGSTGSVTGKTVRTFDVGSQAEGITVDDKYAAIYVSQESKGIWKYDLDPSAGSDRTLVDGVGTGHLRPDVEGLTIYYAQNGKGYLIASSQGASEYAVYDRQTLAYLGKFSIAAGNGIDEVSETDGLDVTNVNLGGSFSDGMLVVHDHKNDTSAATNYKLVPWSDIAKAAGLMIDTGHDPITEWAL